MRQARLVRLRERWLGYRLSYLPASARGQSLYAMPPFAKGACEASGLSYSKPWADRSYENKSSFSLRSSTQTSAYFSEAGGETVTYSLTYFGQEGHLSPHKLHKRWNISTIHNLITAACISFCHFYKGSAVYKMGTSDAMRVPFCMLALT